MISLLYWLIIRLTGFLKQGWKGREGRMEVRGCWKERIWVKISTKEDYTPFPQKSFLVILQGWDGWMASLTRWTWLWVNSGSWWWTGRPGVLQFMGSQRVRHDWVTELNWTEYTPGSPMLLQIANFHYFCHWAVFCCVHIYLFICWWICRLLPYLYYYQYFSYERCMYLFD